MSNIGSLEKELQRMKKENDLLWSIYRACVHCDRCPKDGTIYGCEYQKYLNFSGVCLHRRT